MNLTEQRLLNYVQNYNASELALMINGVWGSGKTHFIQNVFPEKVKDLGKELIYVSLNGVKSVEEVYTSICIEKYTILKNVSESKVGRVSVSLVKTALGLFGKNNEKLQFNLSDIQSVSLNGLIDLKDTVLVLDDFERLSPNAEFVEILGSVSTNIISSSGVKVIYLCDETKISKDINKYNEVKEKYIGWTVQYKNDLDRDIPSIINKYPQEIVKFLNVHSDLIVVICNELKIKNYRTVIFALDALNSISHLLKDRDIGFVRSTIYILFVYSIEYKDGNIITSDDEIGYPEYLELGHLFMNLWEEEKKTIYLDKTSLYKTNEIFRSDTLDVVFYFDKSLLQIVTNNVISEGELSEHFDSLETSIVKQNISDSIRLTRKLRMFNYLSNTEFDRIYYDLLARLKNNLLDLVEFTFLAQVLYELVEQSEYMQFNEHQLNELFDMKVSQIKSNNRIEVLQAKNIEGSIKIISNYNKKLYKEIVDMSESIILVKKSKSRSTFLKELKGEKVDSNSLRDLLCNYSGIEIKNWVIENFDNRKILEAFCYSFPEIVNLDEVGRRFKDSKMNIISLKEELEKDEAYNNKSKVDLFWKNRIYDQIDYFLENFKH